MYNKDSLWKELYVARWPGMSLEPNSMEAIILYVKSTHQICALTFIMTNYHYFAIRLRCRSSDSRNPLTSRNVFTAPAEQERLDGVLRPSRGKRGQHKLTCRRAGADIMRTIGYRTRSTPLTRGGQTATAKPYARCCRTGGARARRQAAGAWGRVKAGEELRLLGHTGPVCHPSGIVVQFS